MESAVVLGTHPHSLSIIYMNSASVYFQVSVEERPKVGICDYEYS